MLRHFHTPLFLNQRGVRLTACLFVKDYYTVLGLGKNCTAKEIRSKYVELCKMFHPDTVTSGDAKELDEKKKKFQEVQEAYNTLSREMDRKSYDDQQQSGYSDFGEGRRAYRPPPQYQQSQDPYERAREYHRQRRRAENTNTDGWTWGDYWKEDGQGHQDRRKSTKERSSDGWFYEQERRRFEQERNQYASYARQNQYRQNNSSIPPFDRFSIVFFCIALVFGGSLIQILHVFSYQDNKKYQEERARIIALTEKRRQARQYDLRDPKDRAYFQMTADEYARRFR